MESTGRQVAEAKALPDFLLERLAELLNTIESSGVWPEALTQGAVHFCNKGEGTAPSKEVMIWQEIWISDKFTGPHMERSMYGGRLLCKPLHTSFCRLIKFSSMPPNYQVCPWIIPSVSTEFQLRLYPTLQAIAHLTLGFCKHYQGCIPSSGRASYSMGPLGRNFILTSGILQGCPLSVVLLNLLVQTWLSTIGEAAPLAEPNGYADDIGAPAK